jgi:hypothetical protein
MSPDKIAAWKPLEHCSRDIMESMSELEREAGLRTRCYDRWVAEGKLSYIDARDRQERLLSAMHHLNKYESMCQAKALQKDAE